MTHRLFIDIPISGSQEDAIKTADHFMNLIIKNNRSTICGLDIHRVNYRLGHDEDRQNRNYFEIDDAGHASTKKSRMDLDNA